VVNRNELTSGRILAIALTVILAAAVCASATIFPPPSWRGEEGTTFQQWSFSEEDYGPVQPDEIPEEARWVNEFGTPKLYVNSSGWSDYVDGHQGVWTFMGRMGGVDIHIPNNKEPQPVKEMWIELTWKAAGISELLPDRPFVNVWADHFRVDLMDETIPDDEEWISTLFKVNIWPNPPGEWITINGDILLDQVIIDTYCIPEPATLGLLSAGALLAFRRRRSVSKV
jgi:hypothetical protein